MTKDEKTSLISALDKEKKISHAKKEQARFTRWKKNKLVLLGESRRVKREKAKREQHQKERPDVQV